jgi:hypothetical protein
MKKLAIISALALSGFAFNSASAQVHVSVGFNLGGPVVVQRPVAVYDDYYYLPEVDAYYSVGENLYYYYNGYEWVAAVYLPGAYSSYNWRNVNHIQIRANRPYLNHTAYRTKYRGTQFDWRRYDNRNDNRNNNRDWDRNAGNNRPGQNRGNDNRPDWNRGNDNRNDNRGGRPDQRNDNRGNDNRGTTVFGRPSQNDSRGQDRPSQNGSRGTTVFDKPTQPGRGEGRPSQNDSRGRGNDNRPNFANNDGGGRRGTRS